MLAMLEGVGFELTQSYIEWIYKTGFPKAYDVSKGIDRKLLGKANIEYNPLSEQTPQSEKIQQISHSTHKLGEPKTFFEPVSDESKKWNGWKSQTGLKPAHEPILMVNKPFSESTIVDNVLRWGTGAINVDSCRIPFQNEVDPRLENEIPRKGGFSSNSEIYNNDPKYAIKSYPSKGRFPANLLVSDKALDNGSITKSGSLEPHHNRSEERNIYGEYKGKDWTNVYYGGDEGSPYRFFDLDAWAEHHGFLDVPKPNNSERDFGLKGRKRVPKSKFNLSDGSMDMRFDGVIPTPRRNTHPTVKPIQLMAYLIELGCPPDGVVLDPFVGSGTTCIAAKRLTRKYVGIEIKPEYVALAEARIEAYPVPLDWFEDESVVYPPNRSREE